MRRLSVLVLSLGLLSGVCGPSAGAEPKPKWPGVDETVVGRFAEELGRAPRDPLINTDQGDLLLFLFTLAGAAGGFVVGYTWHKLFVAGKGGGPER